VRTQIYARIYDNGTTIEVFYNNTIQVDGFIRGNFDISYGDCQGSSIDEHYFQRNPDYEFVPWDSNDYIPEMGGNTTSFKFTPQDAISHAKTNSIPFNTYLNTNPEAYVIDGYYNETQSNPQWNLTFGDKGWIMTEVIIIS
jgi:hypothetical protein